MAEETGKPLTVVSGLKGVWLLGDTGYLLFVWEEPTRSFSYQLDDAGQLGTDPRDARSVELLDDGTLALKSGPATRACAPGDVMTWTDVELHRATLNHEVVTSTVAVRASTIDACLELFGLPDDLDPPGHRVLTAARAAKGRASAGSRRTRAGFGCGYSSTWSNPMRASCRTASAASWS